MTTKSDPDGGIPIPSETWSAGWPEYLTDNERNRYVRLRDGFATTAFSGEICLYGLVAPDGYIDRAHQWTPVLGATARDMRLTGGAWSSSEDLESYGQDGLTMPEEPVIVPEPHA